MDINIRGVSTFFLFAIPAVLAVGAILWLTFFASGRLFLRTVSQDKRHAEIVGAAFTPKAPMVIELKQRPEEPIQIERAEIDGSDLWVYYRNTGQTVRKSIQIKWALLSPDKTVIGGDQNYVSIFSENDAADELDPGERGEAHMKVRSDPRAASIRLSAASFY